MWSSWCQGHPVISCFIEIQNGLTFLVFSYPGCPVIEAIKWVSVLSVCQCYFTQSSVAVVLTQVRFLANQISELLQWLYTLNTETLVYISSFSEWYKNCPEDRDCDHVSIMIITDSDMVQWDVGCCMIVNYIHHHCCRYCCYCFIICLCHFVLLITTLKSHT